MQVKDAMNKNVKTIRPDASVREAAVIMNRYRIGSLVVVSGQGKVEGIVTERDILTDVVAESKNSDDVKIEEIMTHDENLKTIPPEASLEDAAELMSKHKIKKLPVVKKGMLLGIITASDLILYEKHLIEKVSELLVSRETTGLAG